MKNGLYQEDKNIIIKREKGPKEVRSYRPVALTNILQNILQVDKETGLVSGEKEKNTVWL